MKRNLVFVLLCSIIIQVFAQSNYEMVVEKNDGTKFIFDTNDIKWVYFQEIKESSNDNEACDLQSFYLTDGINIYPSFEISDSVVYVKVANDADLSRLKACFTTNGRNVTVNGIGQLSGVTENDFSDFTAPLHYRVESISGKSKEYCILLFDIPVVTIKTEGKTPITNKEDWIPATIKMVDADGITLLEEKVSIRGRGNGSWASDRRSYSLKFEKKEEILGMPKSKRWVLLGQVADWTKLRTSLSLELSKITGFEWSPSGCNVEFILNDTLKCNYFLCEPIRVEKNRINIQEMTPADTLGEAITGGVLFEVSSDYDEINKFRTIKGNYPFMFKNPDEDLQPLQYEYFVNYINSIEDILYSDERMASNDFFKFLDIDSYIRWWLVMEMIMNLEESVFVKNFYMYKDRGTSSLLTAGPPWDFDWGTFRAENQEKWICKNKFWYTQLFSNALFNSRVKVIWNEVRNKLSSFDEFYQRIKNFNRRSVSRDQFIHYVEYSIDNLSNFHVNDEDGMNYNDACDYIKQVFDSHIKWMDNEIEKL